jgi:S1-C subfamily serine protease
MWVTIGSGEGEGLSVKVEGERFLLGSGEEAQLMVTGPGIEPLHAYFQVREDGVVELHPLEGETYVNGSRVEGPVRITGGEEIRVGETLLRPSVEDPAEEAKAVQDADEGAADEGTVVRVETHGEPVEVVPSSERRRIARMSRRAMLLAGGALALAAIAVIAVLALTGDDEKSVAEIVEDAKGRTVLVSVDTGQGGQGGVGSGVVLDADEGHILTNFHVVNGGTGFNVGVEEDSRTAELIAAAPCDDLALLKVDDTDGLESFELASQEDISQGDEVVALGFPANASLEDNLTSTAGTVSVVKSRFRLSAPDAPPLENVVQIDVALSPGNSGGPLVSKEGKLVGINTVVVTEIQGAPIQGQGYAIGIDRVKELDGELQDGRSRGWPGFGLHPADARTLKREKLDLPEGIFARNPVPGTGAEALGVPEIMLTGIAGKRLAPNMTSYCSAVEGVKSGQTVDIEAVDKPGGRPKAAQLKFE